MHLIGVDVGGTFTDIVLYDTATQKTSVHKVATTPADPSIAVVDGIKELAAREDIPAESVGYVRHGTTVATNAVLEHDGAEVGLITTGGYRDIVHIGRHQRPQHYSIRQEIPWQDRTLVKRRHRIDVPERRIPPKGDVLTPLDEDAVRAAAKTLGEAGVEAIAIGFLFSYLDPGHELRAKEIVAEELPGVFVTTSAEVSPQFREFERFTTVSLNAFIGPKVKGYVNRLAGRLSDGGFDAHLHVMTSAGGVATPEMIGDKPVLTLLSGPAAGVLGGAVTGAASGYSKLITFDVGGTSADIALVVDGAFFEASARDTEIGGFPVMVPMIDIHTIGAGGGSIAHLDGGGSFKVGPKSAGARPGPAAYGHGGTEPTVTDANVVLGRLDPQNFLGGAMALDAEAAATVISGLAKKLSLSTETAAEGIVTLLNANMANAIRSRTVQRGIDPREFALVAFGGAGPLHGAEVAEELEIPVVIVPPHPGITSAVGLLTTDLRYDAVRTAFQLDSAIDVAWLNDTLRQMAGDIASQFSADGVDPATVEFARSGDLRYAGQGYELKIPLPDGDLDAAALAAVVEEFHERHRAEYGHGFRGKPVEFVNLKVSGSAAVPQIASTGADAAPATLEAAEVGRRNCLFRSPDGLSAHDTPFLRRDRLPLNAPFNGPAIVLQTDTTTVIPPGWSATQESAGNLVLKRGQGE
ncbi:MAG: hydantoinase/oxoprolinase family protein [Pseudomonadota bacterium]